MPPNFFLFFEFFIYIYIYLFLFLFSRVASPQVERKNGDLNASGQTKFVYKLLWYLVWKPSYNRAIVVHGIKSS